MWDKISGLGRSSSEWLDLHGIVQERGRYHISQQNTMKSRHLVDLLGNGVGEGMEGPAHPVREGVEQDPAFIDPYNTHSISLILSRLRILNISDIL